MIDITNQEFDKLFDQKEHAILLFYTPFCGTCKLAERMLEITLEAKKSDHINGYKCHVSHFQHFVTKWEIMSVPCVIFVKNGEVAQKLYAVESVSHLYTLFDSIFN